MTSMQVTLESSVGKGKLKTVSLAYVRVSQPCSCNLDGGLVDINSGQTHVG
jgi:hypothetical protein